MYQVTLLQAISTLLQGNTDPEPDPLVERFHLYKGQRTQQPVSVPYLLFGYGYLETTRDKAIHYARLRPFVGRADPVLQNCKPNRQRLSQDLGAGERREIEQSIWAALFQNPPTHVLRLGWRSNSTDALHDTLYFPLNFHCPGWNPNGLAKDCVGYLLEIYQDSTDRALLLPTSKIVHNAATDTARSGEYFAAMFWLAHLFYHYQWRTVEEPARRWE